MGNMEANIRQPELWKSDSWTSVEYYNNWFMNFAPQAFRSARSDTMARVRDTFSRTKDLTDINTETILKFPQTMEVLRMVTAPPLAQDRLIGLSSVNKSILKTLEQGRIPKNLDSAKTAIHRMLNIIGRMIDRDLFPWLTNGEITVQQRSRSAAIIADRLTGVISDPIIRNAQEQRQFDSISAYLNTKGYRHIKSIPDIKYMEPNTYSFHVNVSVKLSSDKKVNIPIDVAIQPHDCSQFPILVECKSAGDFTNTNKRRKEEAIKYAQLRETFGTNTIYCLFLCGYFDTGYLGYEAAEGIDWVWEHRIEDFDKLGI